MHVSRQVRIDTLLFRPETLVVLEAIDKQDVATLFASYDNLHAFADLVTEDLVTTEEGCLVTTPLLARSIEKLSKE